MILNWVAVMFGLIISFCYLAEGTNEGGGLKSKLVLNDIDNLFG